MKIDIQKLKYESFLEALAELKQEYSEDINILKKIEEYEKIPLKENYYKV